MTARKEKIEGPEKNWETGALGASEKYARLSETLKGEELDKSMGLQMISIRLEKSLIETLKIIATVNGIGYQPLIRKTLNRFANAEAKRLLKELTTEKALSEEESNKKVA